MRLSDFLRALFVRDVVKDSSVANQAGRQHGVAVADAYCDGLMESAGERLQQRLTAFHSDKVLIVEKQAPRASVKRIAKK